MDEDRTAEGVDRAFREIVQVLMANAANENSIPDAVVVVPDLERFRSTSVVHRLAIVCRNMNISRREWPTWIAGQVCLNDIVFLTERGTPWRVYEIDDLLPANDISHSWFSDLVKFADTRPKQRPHLKLLVRLQMVWVSISLKYPDIAQMIVA